MFLSIGLAYNQPKFCSNATWNSTGITFANKQTYNSLFWDIFITVNNTIYVPAPDIKRILVWFDTNPILAANTLVNSSDLKSVFVTENNDVYFTDQQNSTLVINKLSSNVIQLIMTTCDQCYDIFVDMKNNVYCSMDTTHKVIRKSLNNLSYPIEIVSGTGISGSTMNMLNNPKGIFVDTNFDLYVADQSNHRIQLFPMDQTDGITVAGSESLIPTISLRCPLAVILDANKYLFIADHDLRRIIGSGPYGFRCLIGCNGNTSSFYWRSISFDKLGNIFALETGSHRIQKFELLTNSCSKF